MKRLLIGAGCVLGLLAAGTTWGLAQTGGTDVTCHIDDQNVLTCPLPSQSPSTVPGPTTTVPGPTTTVPGPTTTVTATVTTSPPPPACGGPITITVGGIYSGCYQSSSAATPAVTLATSQPVTLSRAHIIAKGNGVQDTVTGTRLTVVDTVFEQTDPGAVVSHRAVELEQPVLFDFEHNTLTDTDGVWVGANSGQVNPLTVSYNLAVNIGRYPHPTSPNCCVTFLQLDHVLTATGQVEWNHTRNVAGQSGVEDNINEYISGGTDSTHRLDIGHNLIDGAYPRTADTGFTGGGINQGDGGGGHSLAHDNTVVSTTNYGIAVNSADNYATGNVLVNDGAEQASAFGNGISAFTSVTPTGLHATGSSYNWHRSTTDATQYPCYQGVYCSGTAVATTEQQARDAWDVARAAAGVVVGPR